MTLEDMFPRTVFVSEYLVKHGVDKGFRKQLNVVNGELLEAQDAISRKDYKHATEEVIDILHSATQLLYMIPGYSKCDIEKIINKVKDKNNNRGYYDGNTKN